MVASLLFMLNEFQAFAILYISLRPFFNVYIITKKKKKIISDIEAAA